MQKDLIIVESPAKVKTIKKFLGKNYAVEASVGHVRDLPVSQLGVDEENGFSPQYQVIKGKQKVVTKLRKAAEAAENVYLAPDPDREGEAIAWHIAELLKKKNTNIRRIQFNEITSRAVKEALNHPRDLDEELFNSQQARRILDRLVGYKISPILWKKVKRGLSAGRVQSVALRLIVEREKERHAFEPQEYWVLKVLLSASEPPPFWADLFKVKKKKPEVGSKEQAEAIEKAVKKAEFIVQKVEEKERSRSPVPPFITSTLQQAANQRLGYTAKRTMSTAQRLYEGIDLKSRGETMALITYMRTDSVRISNDARQAAKEYIIKTFGKEYYPPKERYFKSKSSSQDAHEAVRPIDVTLTPEDLKSDLSREQYNLYKLIWERFVASQMAAARFWDTKVIIESGDVQWRAKGERLLFPGFLKVMKYSAKDTAELPKLEEGQTLNLDDFTKEQKFTQPPPRYSEASLVKELEDKGIGRPSTYAAIISTLLDRDYARLEEKHFVPTDLGSTVSDLLTKHFSELMDISFTAGMEQSLDDVAEGRVDWVGLLQKFTKDFYPTLDQAQKEMASVKAGLETGLKCEECGKPMVIKFGKAGQFLACSGYPDCRNTRNFTRDENGEIVVQDPEPADLQVVGTCPKCSSDLVIKRARTGSRFIACTGYPKCKHAEPFSTGVACPQENCDGELVERSSRRGKIFYSCNKYPQCDFALWNFPIDEPCPKCDSKVLVHKETKSRGKHIACPAKGCGYYRLPEEEEEAAG